MANTDKMICPSGRVEMNHHCDKLVYTDDAQDARQTDPSLGGVSYVSQMWMWRLASRLGYFPERASPLETMIRSFDSFAQTSLRIADVEHPAMAIVSADLLGIRPKSAIY